MFFSMYCDHFNNNSAISVQLSAFVSCDYQNYFMALQSKKYITIVETWSPTGHGVATL